MYIGEVEKTTSVAVNKLWVHIYMYIHHER